MQLSLTFVTGLIAAGMALAAPAVSEDHITISMSKRAKSLLVPDTDYVDFEAVTQHLNGIRNKYAKTLANAHANSGAAPSKRATSNIALTDEQQESFWAGTVKFGGQSLLIDFDTGSADVVVNPGSYTPGSTSTKTSKTFTNSYGTSGNSQTVRGTVYTDTFSSGSLSASKQAIGLVTSGGNVIDGADGLVGLAYPAISNYGSSYLPLFDTLINSKAVTSNVFGFSLAAGTGSELTLGGLDSTKYTGSITYVPVSAKTYWGVPATAAGVSINSIVDSGTTLIIGDTDSGQAQKFFSNLGVSTFTQDGTLYGRVSCTSPPTISFKYGAKTVTLTKAASIFAQTNDGACVLSVVGTSVGQASWISGDPLFLSSYIAFDRNQNAVGFATRR